MRTEQDRQREEDRQTEEDRETQEQAHQTRNQTGGEPRHPQARSANTDEQMRSPEGGTTESRTGAQSREREQVGEVVVVQVVLVNLLAGPVGSPSVGTFSGVSMSSRNSPTFSRVLIAPNGSRGSPRTPEGFNT